MTDPFARYRPAALAARLDDAGFGHWNPAVPDQVAAAVAPGRHGDLPQWQASLARIATLPRATHDPAGPAVRGGSGSSLTPDDRATLEQTLFELSPWRKGPFSLHGIEIDAEWRSDLKWQRVQAAGIDLRAARILDVGCGNGWYAWRMLAAGAKSVIGVDPTLKHVMQAWALELCLNPPAPLILPLPFEALPAGSGDFDVVFSMGVLYHRRSPIHHLTDLRGHLAPGGSLILETLVVDGDVNHCLCPEDRYARMRNVWFIPSEPLLLRWLNRCGFEDVTLVDSSPTTPDEQRPTRWMPFESLTSALDPDDPTRTVEGLPAPRRAIVTARRQGA
ncbi:MAG: tRNA 5-methoxyuridine(34)/uridine 5-oxyacetic acid(34) synthase CmoB [Gammaproteobacteria bacterium]|nr:tRNA 5-methoxyuridine(34)/uridine 5-oxyacetic acid(34) synthase CmoB [Gammaproteobacteria bacterium]